MLPLIRPLGTFSRWKKREKAIVFAFSRPSWREKVPDRADEGPHMIARQSGDREHRF